MSASAKKERVELIAEAQSLLRDEHPGRPSATVADVRQTIAKALQAYGAGPNDVAMPNAQSPAEHLKSALLLTMEADESFHLIVANLLTADMGLAAVPDQQRIAQRIAMLKPFKPQAIPAPIIRSKPWWKFWH